MPFSLLMALFVAFGLDDLVLKPTSPEPRIGLRIAETMAVVAAVAMAALAFGRWVVLGVKRSGYATPRLRRYYLLGVRLFGIASLFVYAWIIHGLGWATTIRGGFAQPSLAFLQNLLILLPYLLLQLASSWGIYPADVALRSSVLNVGAGRVRYLALRARQTLGLAFPALLVYSFGPDLLTRHWPQLSANPWVQPAEVIFTALTLLAISPLFIRMAWPTHSLKPGPLRDRLENQARRVGFRYSDILVWDTGNGVVNACVTGSLPWFRYVLLSDALLEDLNEHEIAAVFGHELGHIAHRHLLFFGFFIVASLGVMAMFDATVESGLTTISRALVGPNEPIMSTVVESILAFGVIGLYALFVFGPISRRCERQADLFGCRSVSCHEAECPPHVDVDRRAGGGNLAVSPCPVGIRTFANALAKVAILNGVDSRARSWRHGSIANRIDFIERLEGHPQRVETFQRHTFLLRLTTAIILVSALIAAAKFGTFPRLR